MANRFHTALRSAVRKFREELQAVDERMSDIAEWDLLSHEALIEADEEAVHRICELDRLYRRAMLWELDEAPFCHV